MLDELDAPRHRRPRERPALSRAARAPRAASSGARIDVSGFVQLTYAFSTRSCLRAIAQAFAGPVLQLYGASEVGVLFMEGEDGLLHHAPFTTHVELLPARVPTPGAKDVALVVVTTLDRVAQPLAALRRRRPGPGRPRRARAVDERRRRSRASRGAWTTRSSRPDGALVTAGALDRALGGGRRRRALAGQPADAGPGGDRRRRLRGRLTRATAARWCDDARAARRRRCSKASRSAARSATAIPIEPSGKFRVSKRHFPLDVAACFEGVLRAAMGDRDVDRRAGDAAAPGVPAPARGRSTASPLVFLDSASTTPKPRAVIDAVVDYYERSHRERAPRRARRSGRRPRSSTTRPASRSRASSARRPTRSCFVRGTTEAINFVAQALALGPRRRGGVPGERAPRELAAVARAREAGPRAHRRRRRPAVGGARGAPHRARRSSSRSRTRPTSRAASRRSPRSSASPTRAASRCSSTPRSRSPTCAIDVKRARRRLSRGELAQGVRAERRRASSTRSASGCETSRSTRSAAAWWRSTRTSRPSGPSRLRAARRAVPLRGRDAGHRGDHRLRRGHPLDARARDGRHPGARRHGSCATSSRA